MKELRDVLRREAGKVWRERAQATGLGLFMGEETITESVLFRLAMQAQNGGIVVRPFTKAQEAKNGADWEFWFINGASAVGLRLQAKRLFPDGSYRSIDPAQTDCLIGASRGCFSAFVFYNYAAAFPGADPKCSSSNYHGNSYLGCTLASAHRIRWAHGKSAATLCRHMIPWHCLLCSCHGGARQPLPHRVSNNLNALDPDHHDPSGEVGAAPRALSRLIERSGKLPGRMLEHAEPGASEEYPEIEEYLDVRELAGLVLFGAAEEA